MNHYAIFLKNKFNLSITSFLFFFLFCMFNINVLANIHSKNIENIDKSLVIATVKKAESFFKKNGKEKAIIEFRKNSRNIVMGDYNGMFFVSPLHPELIGTNQFNYKDPSGVLVVQEEIEKAKAGGGWLKGRWRKNPQTGKYQCRKIYILPLSGNYFIGSWYHYSSDKEGTCLS